MDDSRGAWHRSTFAQAVFGSALLWAALPPLDLWPLAWVAPIPWVLLIRRSELAGRRPYRAIWLAGFFFWLGAVHWLRLPHWATSLGWLALSFYLAFYLPVFVGLGRVAVHRLRIPVVLAAPVVWTGLELARGHLLTGFTMASLGHTQYRWIDLIQVADLGGAYGVGFVVMFVAACLGRMVPLEGRRPAYWPLPAAAAMLIAVLAYGHGRTAVPPPPVQARVALIQGSIDITLKADPKKASVIHQQYDELTRQALVTYSRPDLIVWPETMLRHSLVVCDRDAQVPPDWDSTEGSFRERMLEVCFKSSRLVGHLAGEIETPMIVGVDTWHFAPDGMHFYNSAVCLSKSGEVGGRYDKMHPVMFGEYVPFADRFPWLQRLTPLPSSLTSGRMPASFEVSGLRYAPNVCFETVIPHLIRDQVNVLRQQGQEPDVLVNLTNDGWFWGSSELDMHLVCGVFRAVECRKPVLIAANTGFSAWIDDAGRIRAQGRRRETDTLLAEVGRSTRRSPYLTYGDLPAGICLAATLALAAVGLAGRWRARAGSGKKEGGKGKVAEA